MADWHDDSWAADVVTTFLATSDTDAGAVAALAEELAHSGKLREGQAGENDVASTGGPGSLTTFLCPLIMVVDGASVPKVGVPGRPAGVVDSFASIPGYRVQLTGREFERILATSGFANAEADAEFAPADGLLFRIRQEMGAQAVPGLVAASLLSKKLAVGLRQCTIDIRVGAHGNFGVSPEHAAINAELLSSAGGRLGIAVTTVITDSADIGQPYFGRLEALTAVARVVGGLSEPWLDDHFDVCVSLARSHASNLMTRPKPSPAELCEVLDANLVAQGLEGGFTALVTHLDTRSADSFRADLRAVRSGTLSLNFGEVRAAIVDEQTTKGEAYADPAGVVMHMRPGSSVRSGDIIATV